MYSQLAGVLAGFAFLAITQVLGRQHRRETAASAANPIQEHLQDKRVIAALGCAFLGLIAATALYATLAAAQGCALTDGSAASEEVLAGVAFAFSIYTLLFAAVQLVSAAALEAHLRFIVAVITPPIVTVFIGASLSDLALSLAKPPADPNPHGPLRPMWTDSSHLLWDRARFWSLWLTLGVFVGCAVAWLLGLLIVRRAKGTPRRGFSTVLLCLPYASLLLVIYAVCRSISFSSLEPGKHISVPEAWWLVGVSVVLIVAQSVCISFVRGADRDESDPHGRDRRNTVRVPRPLAAVIVLVCVFREFVRASS